MVPYVLDTQFHYHLFYFLFIDFKERERREVAGGERERDREREINLLFHLLMCSLADSCTCPDRESNLQPWHMGTML